MKKWFITISVITIVFVIAISAFVYYIVRAPLEQGYEQAERYVVGQHILDEVDTITYYHGTEPFYVLHGKREGEEIIVWIQQSFDQVVSRKVSEGITVEEALSKAKADLNISSVERIRLGFERDVPIYEVVFVDKENRQGYYYVTFDDGTFMKRYSLRRD